MLSLPFYYLPISPSACITAVSYCFSLRHHHHLIFRPRRPLRSPAVLSLRYPFLHRLTVRPAYYHRRRRRFILDRPGIYAPEPLKHIYLALDFFSSATLTQPDLFHLDIWTRSFANNSGNSPTNGHLDIPLLVFLARRLFGPRHLTLPSLNRPPPQRIPSPPYFSLIAALA